MDTNQFFNSFIDGEKQKAEQRAKQQQSKPEEFLQLKIGGTYVFGILPVNMAEYDEVSFNSRLDGTFQYLGLSPQSISLGKNILKTDPISKRLWKAWNAVKDSNDKAAQTEALQLVKKTRRLANVYVISDSTDVENNKKVKILNFGAGFNNKTKAPTGNIWKKLHSAIQGDLMESYGARLFDLGEDGINVILTVKEKKIGQKTIPEYDVNFVPRKKADAVPAKAQGELIAQAHALEKFIPELKSIDEMESILMEHWDCSEASSELDTLENAASSASEEDDFDFGNN